MFFLCLLLQLLLAWLVSGASLKKWTEHGLPLQVDDARIPPRVKDVPYPFCAEGVEFKYKWVGLGGTISDIRNPAVPQLEVSATMAVTTEAQDVGTQIVALMLRNMPESIFVELAIRGSAGLFTAEDGTTIFPEYCHLRDRPECEGTCAGACSNTCTSDGRKYDSLAGLGGSRGTCLDDNYMCTASDPYQRMTNILVHEFSHTIHQYGLPYQAGNEGYWRTFIHQAYENAWNNNIWDRSSYAMVNDLEYFAEATGVYFNVNNYSSTGGMNSCGRPSGPKCQSEEEARAWLQQQDPDLFTALAFTYSTLPGDLRICLSQP